MPSPLPLLLLLGGGIAALAASRRSPHAAPPPAGPGLPALPSMFDANMPPDVAAAVQSQLVSGTNPDALEQAASALATQGYPIAAAQLRAKAMALRAAASQAQVMQQVSQVLAQQPSTPAAPSGVVLSPGFVPATPAETAATAQQVVQQAQASPAPAASQAAQAAATAATAAATQNPATAVQAAQQAIAAAQTAASQPAATQAAQAMQTALQAAATNNPQLVAQAANQAAQAAQTAVLTTTATQQGFPPPSPAPDARLAQLALAAANEIRTKKCWHENRAIIKAYQEAEGGTASTPGAAGIADGYYGPATALRMMRYMTKVPAPCYWPQQSTARAQAQKDWQNLVKTGKVTVGHLAAAAGAGHPIYAGGNPVYVG